ncbi:hypothetical protein ACRAWD_22080 [Caulobacter segnis]
MIREGPGVIGQFKSRPMTSPSASSAIPDICVVGAGPLGIALALACRKRGLGVLLLESGTEDPHPKRPPCPRRGSSTKSVTRR